MRWVFTVRPFSQWGSFPNAWLPEGTGSPDMKGKPQQVDLDLWFHLPWHRATEPELGSWELSLLGTVLVKAPPPRQFTPVVLKHSFLNILLTKIAQNFAHNVRGSVDFQKPSTRFQRELKNSCMGKTSVANSSALWWKCTLSPPAPLCVLRFPL